MLGGIELCDDWEPKVSDGGVEPCPAIGKSVNKPSGMGKSRGAGLSPVGGIRCVNDSIRGVSQYSREGID